MSNTHTGVLLFLDHAAATGLLVSLPAFPLGLIIRPLRRLSGNAIYFSSIVIGADVWLWSASVVFHLWGTVALLAGLLLFGVGVAPMAILASATHGSYRLMGELIFNVVLIFAFRLIGRAMSESAKSNRASLKPDAGIKSLATSEI